MSAASSAFAVEAVGTSAGAGSGTGAAKARLDQRGTESTVVGSCNIMPVP